MIEGLVTAQPSKVATHARRRPRIAARLRQILNMEQLVGACSLRRIGYLADGQSRLNRGTSRGSKAQVLLRGEAARCIQRSGFAG
jgi:hypothetical protein